jgi:hypothetical protein
MDAMAGGLLRNGGLDTLGAIPECCRAGTSVAEQRASPTARQSFLGFFLDLRLRIIAWR